jgi:class 3 adenylate cyclase/tetratricopeptide (TPR) repeat protein
MIGISHEKPELRCDACGFENRQGVNFCTRCGNSLVSVCPGCRLKVVSGDLYCGGCGHSLSNVMGQTSVAQPTPSSSALQGDPERKNVTVLFADISGFTEISEKMDPEEVTALMNGSLKQLADIVLKYEGHVDKFIGDCIMAIFGAPITHENDPERAIRAAIEMKDAMESYNKTMALRLERPLTLHTGINSGIVVAGGVGSDQKMEYTVMGDTVNLASRLESLAVGGQIFISKYTHNLVRNDFDFIEHEPIKVKGKKDPVPVFEVKGIKAKRRDERSNLVSKVPLIGRSEEMGALKGRVDRLLSGESQVVFLKSDAGMGKSRIQMEVETYLSDKPVQVIYGSCHSFSQSTSYYMLAEILKGLFSIDSEDMPEAMAEKLTSALPVLTRIGAERRSEEVNEAAVFLGCILGLDLGEDYDIPTAQMDAEEVKAGIFRSIKWLFVRLSENNPLVLILEDLHYADNITVEVINYLLETIQDSSVMLLLLMRPEEHHSSANLSSVAQKNLGSRCTEILVGRFSPQESDELVRSLLQTPDVPDSILHMIRARADGNPFYIEAMVRDLMDSEIIQAEPGGKVSILKDVDQVAIPDTIQGMVVSRIDRLPGKLKDILQAASVIGPVFNHELLEEVMGHNYLEGHLNRLVEMDMLYESKSYPEIEYRFKNMLTREAAYSCLLRSKQRELHGVVARAIEGLYHDRIEDHFEVLAMHYHTAQDSAKAYDYHVKSGVKARRIFANENAIDHLNAAIEMGNQTENGLDPEVHISLSEVYELTGDLDMAIESREKAIEILDGDLAKADSTRNVGRILEKKGNKEAALEIYESVFDMLTGHPDSIEMGRLLMNQGWVLNRMKKSDEAIENCGKALKLFEAKHAEEDIAQTHNNLAVFFENKGDLDLALKHNEKSRDLFSGLNNKRKLANVFLSLGYVYNKREEYETALEYFEQSVTTMAKIGNRYGAGTALMAKGRCYIDMGRLDEAESVLNRSLRIHQDLNLKLKIVANLLTLVRVYLEMDEMDSARRCLADARKLASDENNRSDLAKIAGLEELVKEKELV